MKKIILNIGICAGLMSMAACSKFLDRAPLSVPATGNFLTNEKEVNVALTAVYRSLNWDFGTVPYQSGTDGWTDIAILRAFDLGEGTYDTYNSHPANIWKSAYVTIQRANTMLEGMEMAKNSMPEGTFNRLQAEARVLRAWSYHYLAYMFGGAPLIKKPLLPDEFRTQTRATQAELIKFIYDELDAAAPALNWAPTERGRASRAMALGLKARTALYNKDYAIAAAAAKSVIDNANLTLNPKFQDLFTRSGQKPNAGGEILLEVMYSEQLASSFTYLPLGNCSRAAGGQSGRFPSQRLVDMFEAKDGKRIDESTVYNPLKPRENRDLRLKYTVAMPGDTCYMNLVTFVYDIYKSTTSFKNADGSWTVKSNADYDNAFGPAKSGLGYLWSKYTMTDENAFLSRVNFILMRYAEILLTYAEAKIELNELDATMLDAINKVRARAGQPKVETAIEGNQGELRELIRRERTVELAVEGFRWFDIRRWNIAQLVMPGKTIGIALDPANMPPVPNFRKSPEHDLNSIPDYSAQENLRRTRETRYWDAKLNLLPVPQGERDLNQNLTPNPGWD
ncbi:RagB/SusD family nutrient uptake outer membrane protein [Chitinophaga lutea]